MDASTKKILSIYEMLTYTLIGYRKSRDEQLLDDLLEALAEVSRRALIRLESVNG